MSRGQRASHPWGSSSAPAGAADRSLLAPRPVACWLAAWWLAALLLAALGSALPGGAARAAADDLAILEEEAMREAVARVAPAVVRIETVGGLERVGQTLIGSGPTTGLVVGAEGWIISSAFNFVQRPSSILVTLADGTRVPATLVATDTSRMLALLKVEPAEPLAVAEPVPQDELRVGQWAIAVGRTFDSDDPNVAVGIVSALARIWGKAIQTDAAVSPSNYGGPLVDLSGRVLGVLVPMSPESGSELAGFEWYDSGIGFAVPLEHVYSVLPRLAQGVDLKPGILGVSLRTRDLYGPAAELASVRVNSPAYHAGFKPGDRVIEVDGAPIERQAQLMGELNRRYAGDRVTIRVRRGRTEIERELELVATLQPYRHPLLGALPRRDDNAARDGAAGDGAARGGAADDGAAGGVVVRWVYPGSPADEAGLEIGDRITSLAGEPLAGRDDLLERLCALAAGQTVEFEYERDGETLRAEVKLAALPETLPPELPPARDDEPRKPAAAVSLGRFELSVPEWENAALVYVPEDYHPEVPHGLLVWLHPPGGSDEDELIAAWQEHCRQHDLILLAPRAADLARWTPAEIPLIRKLVDEIRQGYRIDPTRIVAHGRDLGGTLAYALALAHRDVFRAAAVVDAPVATRLLENEPVYRLAFYLASTPAAPAAEAMTATARALRRLEYPVTEHALFAADSPSDEERAQLVRWIDALDRF